MKKIILLSILLITLGNSSIIDDYMTFTDNRQARNLEYQLNDIAMECSKGKKESCVMLGIGSIGTSAWHLRDFLQTIRGLGGKSKYKKVKRIVTKLDRIYSKKRNSSHSSRGNNRSNQKNYTLILPKRNINGHQVIIYVMTPKNNNYAYIQVDGHRISMVQNGRFLSVNSILNRLPRNLRNSRLIRKKIISAKVTRRNQMR
jgi:hypothetical protein